MQQKENIKLNQFQLNVLLSDEQKQVFNSLLQNGVFCMKCKDICSKGINVNEIHLNPTNDIKVEGTCNTCNGKVTRIIEFGMDREFFDKADKYRKSLAR